MSAALVVLSCAHVGAPGAISDNGQIIESGYSKRIVTEIGIELSRRHIGWTICHEADLAKKAAFVDAVDSAVCAIEPHLNSLRKQDVADEDHDGDHQEFVADQRGTGTMTMFSLGDAEEQAFAECVDRSLHEALLIHGFKSWGPQPVPGPMCARKSVRFLNETKKTAVLPEMLFLSHPKDAAFLVQPHAPKILAIAIANGIESFLTLKGVL